MQPGTSGESGWMSRVPGGAGAREGAGAGEGAGAREGAGASGASVQAAIITAQRRGRLRMSASTLRVGARLVLEFPRH